MAVINYSYPIGQLGKKYAAMPLVKAAPRLTLFPAILVK